MALITLKRFTYRYPLARTPALHDVSLAIEAGECLAVIGANGAGKSTLAYALAGFLPHVLQGEVSGQLTLGDQEVTVTPHHLWVERVGLVLQNPFSQLSGVKFTVYDEVAFGLENLGLPPADMPARVDEALALTGLTDLAKRSPYELSGGQQQRVALAAMLAMRPQVLTLDEPTAQLDPLSARTLLHALKTLTQRGMTLVIMEHDLEHVAALADRVAVLRAGQVMTVGPALEILGSPCLKEWGLAPTRYTQVARLAQARGWYPTSAPPPVTLAQAIEALSA